VLEEKATQFKHMTVRQAAHVASEQNVGTLILTHFSQRYKTVEELEAEAQAIFPDTICAYDFMNIKF
jgi:ribonuclease Z